MPSTHLKNISEIGSSPQIEVKINNFRNLTIYLETNLLPYIFKKKAFSYHIPPSTPFRAHRHQVGPYDHYKVRFKKSIRLALWTGNWSYFTPKIRGVKTNSTSNWYGPTLWTIGNLDLSCSIQALFLVSGFFQPIWKICARSNWRKTTQVSGWKFQKVFKTTIYLWTSKPWKMKVLNPQYMGCNP